MTFEIDTAFLPATLNCQPMSDQEFAAFCAEHPDLNFEMSEEGELIVMAPAHSDTGHRNLQIAKALGNWADADGRGYACDSSTGYVLANGARRSPDASWILKARVKALGSRKLKSFWHLCPDFAIELKSDSDRLKTLQRKMREYIVQGCGLGWLIDPDARFVEVYRPGGEVERFTGVTSVEGEGPVAGFKLDLKEIWDPFGDENPVSGID
jgi:Uma2 family endonuclease